MIDHLCGELIGREQNGLVVRAGGIGFYIEVPLGTYADLAPGDRIEVPTALVFREQGASLYGFSTPTERKFFLLLTTISGIGPKSALSILGQASPAQLADAIIREDISALVKVKGIGKKGARRIIVELGEKIRSLKSSSCSEVEAGDSLDLEAPVQEAQDVLISLGCSKEEADYALRQAMPKFNSTGSKETEILVMHALKELGAK